MQFVFFAYDASVKTTVCVLTECLIHCNGILYIIASDQGTHYTAKEMWQWAYAHGILWPYHVLHHHEAAGLTEWLNGPLKITLQCQLGGSTLQEYGKVLQKAEYALHHHPICGVIYLIVLIHGSKNQGVEMVVTPLTVNTSDPLATFLLPVPVC